MKRVTGTNQSFFVFSAGNAQSHIHATVYRGGLVPVRSEGALVTDKPAAFDFGAGFDVSESGGAAIINLIGEADVLKLPEQAGDPTAVSDDGYVYSKDAAGITELFYMDDAGTVTQMTSDGYVVTDGYNGTVQVSASISFVITDGLITSVVES
jgi:hypothetical protein